MTEADEPGASFPWPSASNLVGDFGGQARLLESGRYMKISKQNEPERVITVFVDDAIVKDASEALAEDARTLYPGRAIEVGVKGLLSALLFECLDSMPDDDSVIVYRPSGFWPLSELGESLN